MVGIIRQYLILIQALITQSAKAKTALNQSNHTIWCPGHNCRLIKRLHMVAQKLLFFMEAEHVEEVCLLFPTAEQKALTV